MKPRLYHFEVYMPAHLARPVFEGRLRYGHHAKQEALCDRYGIIELPRVFNSQVATLIETEVDEDRVPIKQVWRQPLDAFRDIVLVITNQGFVKTVWVNLSSDQHRTLNTTRYARA